MEINCCKENIIKEIDFLPEKSLAELLTFIQYLKYKIGKSGYLENDTLTHIVSEASLSKEWLQKEEDEAWGNL